MIAALKCIRNSCFSQASSAILRTVYGFLGISFGMKAYSLNLRERVAATCQQPGRTIGAVDAQFSVSVSFVEKLLQRQRTSSSLAPRPLLERVQPRRLGGLPALAARCHPGRVTGVAGRARRTRREPGDDGLGLAGSGLTAKKRASTPRNATPSG